MISDLTMHRCPRAAELFLCGGWWPHVMGHRACSTGSAPLNKRYSPGGFVDKTHALVHQRACADLASSSMLVTPQLDSTFVARILQVLCCVAFLRCCSGFCFTRGWELFAAAHDASCWSGAGLERSARMCPMQTSNKLYKCCSLMCT